MKKVILAGVAAVAVLGSSAVYAQHRFHHHHHQRMSAEDRAAFVDARIAAVKAGLKLTPDQEKLWPPVETAVRIRQAAHRHGQCPRQRARGAARGRDQKAADGQKGADNKAVTSEPAPDAVARLRERADKMAETAAGLKKIADAADPLYKTLDESQEAPTVDADPDGRAPWLARARLRARYGRGPI
jgi:hypothetical protein